MQFFLKIFLKSEPISNAEFISSVASPSISVFMITESPKISQETVSTIPFTTTYKEDGLKMSIHFYEPGVGFAGEMKFAKGEEDKYHIVDWCQDNEAEYIKYVIENDMEPLEYYIDECYYWISEMHQSEGEEVVEKIFLAVEKQLVEADLDNAVKLILDIKEKYDEFCNK